MQTQYKLKSPDVSQVLVLAGMQGVPGFLRGLRQPAVWVQVRFAAGRVSPQVLQRCGDALASLQPLPAVCQSDPAMAATQSDAALPLLLADALLRLQASAGLTLWQGAQLEWLRHMPGQLAQREALMLVPSPVPQVLVEVLAPLVAHLNAVLQAGPAEPAGLERLVAALARWAPGGTNNRHILREAGALGMPVLGLPGGVFQLGWGRRSRLFKSTITDGTGAVATAWAKDKVATNALLRMAGLPVPAQRPVTSLDAALQAAQRLGYPVVLKPVDLDQGLGVEADLRTEADLRAAYDRAARHGHALVLEKHVPGEDYRVYVVGGELMGVAHRVPARVVGDGVATVAQLVAAVNEQRRTAGGQATVYKPIELDAEALELLAREGFDASSCVPAGRVLRLRRSANSSRGGTSVDATHLAHPDNVALCVQAAAVLRLDVAGLDLLTPDISRSWREVGAAFCEVNAQPQMGGAHPWIFERILRRYVQGRGRIPAVLVLTEAGDAGPGDALAQALEGGGWRAALVQGSGARLHERTRAAVMRPDLEALVVQTDGVGLARLGWPLDRFDVAVVSGWAESAPERQALLRGLGAHVSGVVLWDDTGAAPGDAMADRGASVGWQLLAPWAAGQPPLLGQGATPTSRLQRVAGAQALPQAVLRCVQALHHA